MVVVEEEGDGWSRQTGCGWRVERRGEENKKKRGFKRQAEEERRGEMEGEESKVEKERKVDRIEEKRERRGK